MKIEIRNEELISCIIEVLENNLESANAEIEKLKGYRFENEELYKEKEKLIVRISELKIDLEFKTVEADKLKDLEDKFSDLIKEGINNLKKIKSLEDRNKELEELQKKTAKSVNQADMDFMKRANKELEDRIDELTRENLKLSRQLIKFKPNKSDAGELVAELIKEIQLEQKPRKKGEK